MNEFDIKAAGWDSNPMHWDRSEAIAKEIIKLIPLKKEMTAYGVSPAPPRNREIGIDPGARMFSLSKCPRNQTGKHA
jgi:hypothetical protein